ncbi:alpha-beta hydrolase superfamily lysophospholipase [Haloferula luteola]|uniref:Alpha-beta hydrolase superfamily lysophospholipase n=1 Tax=Haloferula luteola TaxID=595692 RepID=A0A840V8X2_9BACT|nr:alpha/beta fold hydrolase [Haloferula luteola]MBB5351168.1 alpha-beta hydrolase superfamily lysophospholipase [Haloferula luteola]
MGTHSFPNRLAALVFIGLAVLLASCAPSYQLVTANPKQAVKEETFSYRKWQRHGTNPDVVVIALHGFSGASIDYENLASYLMRHQPSTALYAYEVRGQGRDPKKDRRGDIDDPANWSNDLLTFTRLIKSRHPDATLVWFGESMGSLILSKTYHDQIAAGHSPPCDALALSSPVVTLRSDFPTWKKELVRGLSVVAPAARISMDTLSGGQDVQMTETSFHSEQSETNSWNLETNTLRLLVALGDLIDEMPANAEAFREPTLILHGGKDFFTTKADVQAFANHIPAATPLTECYYPEAHHLLMYDTDKDQVIQDIARWLDTLRSGS